jgi:hypothetical protein
MRCDEFILMRYLQAINQSYESGLQQGLLHESRAFWSTFATQDQKVKCHALYEGASRTFTRS